MSACASIEKESIIINTKPQGAEITVSEINNETGRLEKIVIGISPVDYQIVPQSSPTQVASFDDDDSGYRSPVRRGNTTPQYTFHATKEGYFSEEKAIEDYRAVNDTGQFLIRMEKSPLWWDTTLSEATNEWVNLTVNSEISDVDMWQRIISTVTKRFPGLKEYDFTSGYLLTEDKMKRFETTRGVFYLRSKFIATVMSRAPLTYKLKIVSEWSNRETTEWNPYPRAFKEDAELVTELMNRFRAY